MESSEEKLAQESHQDTQADHGETSDDVSGRQSASWSAIFRRRAGKQTKPRRRIAQVARWALRAAVLLAVVRTFIGETSVVPTASMEGTILVGDHLLWNKAQYGPQIPFTHWRLP